MLACFLKVWVPLTSSIMYLVSWLLTFTYSQRIFCKRVNLQQAGVAQYSSVSSIVVRDLCAEVRKTVLHRGQRSNLHIQLMWFTWLHLQNFSLTRTHTDCIVTLVLFFFFFSLMWGSDCVVFIFCLNDKIHQKKAFH